MIFDIAEGVKTTYNIGSSQSSIRKARAYLDSIGYYTQLVDHTPSLVQQSLYMNKPVYMRGKSLYNGVYEGHAWICDGYVYEATDVNVSLQVISYAEPLYYQTIGDTYTYTTSTLSFYMNWGYGNYSSLYTTSGVDTDWFGQADQYKYSRRDLINVEPLN